jgi:hypothetical protein
MSLDLHDRSDDEPEYLFSGCGRATAAPLTICCRLVVCTRSSRSRLQVVSPTGGDVVAERLKENREHQQARAGYRAPGVRDERYDGFRTHVVPRLVLG